ncbi:MAG: LPS-assembly protein LptD [Pseudomonadota bacterium]
MSWFSAFSPSQRRAFALSALVTASVVPAHAQTPAKRVRPDDKNAPVTASAEEMSGRPEREVTLERDVEITRGPTRLKADTACFRQVEDEVEAQGHVRMWRYGDYYQGDQLKLNLDSGKGWVLNPAYKMELNNAQGKATRMDFISEDEAVVVNGTYSTCEGPNPDWYLQSSTLQLDSGRDVGIASKTVIYFKGVPIIATPAMSFSLSGARRSGWLPPVPGFGSKGGAELTVPYYFNIAPNRDLTLYPKYIWGRGLQVGAHGRYMGLNDAGTYAGETQAEVLPHDRIANADRWLVKSTHSQALARYLSFGWNLNAASDNDYPSDFSKSISTSAERQLLRELRTDYVTPYWSLSARVQNYQVLQDPAAATDPTLTVARPYDRLPQINFHAGRYDINGFDWAVDAEATRFWHPTLVKGERAVVTPQISFPWVRPGYFVTPKVLLNASSYNIDATATAPAHTQSRVLPTVSVDSGLVFERDAKLFGKEVTQTLEPRLFYVYTPYKDQSTFPNFDSAEAGFNFAQIFNENRFIGSDRIGDADQVTAAIVSRFIEPNGAERLRLALGQRFYFREQRVFLDATTPRIESRSDVLLAASGSVAKEWSFDSAVQYNASARRIYSSNYGLQWKPGEKKVINAEYRYLRDSFKNIDVSSQWPLSLRWYGVGRVSYSLRDRKILESLVGLEYKADCWVFRMGAQRFVTTAQRTSTNTFFSLELNGLAANIGPGNALETLHKSIPGYSRVNQERGL